MAEQKETSFYSDNSGVRITNTRAILGTKTYAMANISSVSAAITPAKRGLGIVLAIIGFLLVLVPESGVRIFGVILLGVGILLAVIAKATYIVRIGSASGEADAISSHDRAYVDGIVTAMNEAFIKRG